MNTEVGKNKIDDSEFYKAKIKLLVIKRNTTFYKEISWGLLDKTRQIVDYYKFWTKNTWMRIPKNLFFVQT